MAGPPRDQPEASARARPAGARPRWPLALAAVLVSSCSAPAQLAELQAAEDHERAGRHEEALRAYEEAQRTCQRIDRARRRRQACGDAHLHRAELLHRLGRLEEAARAYSAIPAAIAASLPASGGDDRHPDITRVKAQATLRAGEIYLELGRDELAYTHFWRAVTDYPDEAFAGDAVKVLLRDGRRREPHRLYQILGELVPPLAHTEVASNLLHAMAELAEDELGAPEVARALHDRIAADYPESGFLDDALWHGARLSRALGDPDGAVERLRRLLATREVAWGPGSYFSVWLDDAQLELGRVLRDDLRDLGGAIAAFELLPRHYPASILRDDAAFERAATLAAAGRTEEACAALADLAGEFPDSKFELERAPALRAELGCPLAADR